MSFLNQDVWPPYSRVQKNGKKTAKAKIECVNKSIILVDHDIFMKIAERTACPECFKALLQL